MISGGFGWLAVALPLAGFASYFRDTVRGRTQPNRVSWALWAAVPGIAFAAELAQQVSLRTALVTLALAAGPAAVLAASLVSPEASWQTRPLDWACAGLGAGALAALIAGTVTGRHDTAATAIALSIAADACAAVPTIAKACSHPESETVGTYAASGAGSVIALLTLHRWGFASYGFPLYVAAVCAVIIVLVTRRIAARWLRGSCHAFLSPGRPRTANAPADSRVIKIRAQAASAPLSLTPSPPPRSRMLDVSAGHKPISATSQGEAPAHHCGRW
jgi:hypothetical protein